jgi:catechol 2,3-dioxygenase-like lactoylglutathione lyase family enzyme
VTRPSRGPAGPRGLRHVALRSRDLRATERFYVDVLGLRVAFPSQGMLFLETPGGGDLLNFVATRRAFDAAAGGLDHLGLRVPPAGWRAAMARLRRARVRIEGRRGRVAVYVRDPNGYTVELYRD